MSRRKEIKLKEEMQLQLQAQFNKLDQTVLSWLNNPSNETNDNITKQNDNPSVISKEFSNQIIIPSGKGINFGDSANAMLSNDNTDGNVTIGDFLDSTVSKNQLKNNKGKNDGKIEKVGQLKRRNGNGISSNSLRALSNKLRDEKRGRPHVAKNANGAKPAQTGSNKYSKQTSVDESDDEDDDEILYRESKSSRTTAKTSKNKRPF